MAHTINEFRHASIELLYQSELLVPRIQLNKMQEDVVEKGKEEFDYLQNNIGKNKFDNFLKCQFILEKKGRDANKSSLFRVLGYGYYFTDFFSKFRKNPTPAQRALNHLGALANLIISLYDFFIDANLMKPIDQKHFIKALTSDVHFKKKLEKNIFSLYRRNSFHKLIIDLSIFFTSRIKPLISDKELKNLLIYINTALTLQNKIYRNNKAEAKLIQEKSIWPFSILAFIAQCNECEIPFENTILYSWVKQFGIFIGLIDDLTDYENDLKNRDINIIEMHYMKSTSPDLFIDDLKSLLSKIFTSELWLSKKSEGSFLVSCINSWISIWDEYPLIYPNTLQEQEFGK